MNRPVQCNMDDVFERMREFHAAIQKFQTSLNASLADLRRTHEAVDPLWRDNARKDYDTRYQPLHDRLVRYAEIEGPIFEEFMRDKSRWLDMYLHGDR